MAEENASNRSESPAEPLAEEETDERSTVEVEERKRTSLLALLERLTTTKEKIITIRDDHIIITEPYGWGMRELNTRFKANITPIEFARQAKEIDLQKQMDTLFSASVTVFQEQREETALPEAPWVKSALRYTALFMTLGLAAVLLLTVTIAAILNLFGLIVPVACMAAACFVTFVCSALLIYRFKSDGLWPGLMEERLQAMTKCRFPEADVEIREALNVFASLFLDNNWNFVKLKRRLQMVAVGMLYVATVPTIFVIKSNNSYLADPAVSMLGIIWVLGWAVGGLIIFYVLNDEVFQDKYAQALRISANNVSQMMIKRLNALDYLFQHYYNHINTIQATGEGIAGAQIQDISSMHDEDLKGHQAFYCTQIMLWLAKRLEYLELHMLHRMHSAQTIHSVLNIAGFIATTSICIVGVAPMLAFLAYSNTGIDFSIPVLGKSVSMVAAINLLGAATILMTMWVSWRSYANRKWNSGKHILYGYFKTNQIDGWHTVASLRYDQSLAGRSQRAMIQIKYLNDLLASKRN